MTKPFSVDANTPPTMVIHYKQPLENDRIGQWDFTDPRTGKARKIVLEIERLTQYIPERPKKRKMADGSYREEKRNKYDVTFRGQKKTWISGPVTQAQIAVLYGKNMRDWIGKRVTLYYDPDVMMGKDKTGGVRVENVRPSSEPTREVIDNPVDPEARAKIDAALGREPGSDDV